MTIATFEALAARTYTFEVEMPDGELMHVEMRALTQDEAWALDRTLPARPVPPTKDLHRDESGKISPVYDYEDPAYVEAWGEYTKVAMHKKILACWTADVPGKTEDEKLAALRGLSNWALAALWKCTQMVLQVEGDAIKARSFQRDGNTNS